MLSFDEIGAGVRGDTCIPDFDRPVVRARDDLRSIVVEGHRADVVAVRARLLRLELQGSCSKRGAAQLWVRRAIVRARVPASQTLIVWSSEPETIFVPSLLKATDITR